MALIQVGDREHRLGFNARLLVSFWLPSPAMKLRMLCCQLAGLQPVVPSGRQSYASTTVDDLQMPADFSVVLISFWQLSEYPANSAPASSQAGCVAISALVASADSLNACRFPLLPVAPAPLGRLEILADNASSGSKTSVDDPDLTPSKLRARRPSALTSVRGDQLSGLQLLLYVASCRDFFGFTCSKVFEISPLNGDIAATSESTYSLVVTSPFFAFVSYLQDELSFRRVSLNGVRF